MDEGQKIARELIAKEASQKTGFLDLGGLGLSALPKTLFGLSHLQHLNLGSYYYDGRGDFVGAQHNIAANSITEQIAELQCLKNLTSLSICQLKISDLTPVSQLRQLQNLNFNGCTLKIVPEGFWGQASLKTLYLYETNIPGIPTEVLSQGLWDNYLAALRAHLLDIASGETALRDVKLMVLGNGQIGKTQICRRLRGEGYDDQVEAPTGYWSPAPHSRAHTRRYPRRHDTRPKKRAFESLFGFHSSPLAAKLNKK